MNINKIQFRIIFDMFHSHKALPNVRTTAHKKPSTQTNESSDSERAKKKCEWELFKYTYLFILLYNCKFMFNFFSATFHIKFEFY